MFGRSVAPGDPGLQAECRDHQETITNFVFAHHELLNDRRHVQGRDEKGDTAGCMKHMEEVHTATSGHLSSSWGKVVEMRLSAKIRYQDPILRAQAAASTFNAPATRWPDLAPA